MAKKYIWTIEFRTEHACYDYNSYGLVYYTTVIRNDYSFEECSAYEITDEYFLKKECEFLIYELPKGYKDPAILKKLKPNWIFKGTANALWEELNKRWEKQEKKR